MLLGIYACTLMTIYSHMNWTFLDSGGRIEAHLNHYWFHLREFLHDEDDYSPFPCRLFSFFTFFSLISNRLIITHTQKLKCMHYTHTFQYLNTFLIFWKRKWMKMLEACFLPLYFTASSNNIRGGGGREVFLNLLFCFLFTFT